MIYYCAHLEFVVKFDRASVIALFEGKTGNYTVEITGTWKGIKFKGIIKIKVI
jgi:hypothetical protein